MRIELAKSKQALRSPRSRVRPELSSSTVGSIAKASQGSIVSLNFLAALNDCISATALPHPVTARNADLVPAWQRWSAWQEGALNGTSTADRMIASTRKNFDQCVDMIKDGLRIDPIWKKGIVAACAEQQLDTSAVFAAAPLMFWRRAHALVELSPALQQLLARSDLGDDIPIGLLRPPVSACYIRFSEGMQHAAVPRQSRVAEHSRIEGVYVFEAVREEMRAVALVVIWAEDDQATLSVSSININISDETETLAAVIERICAKASHGLAMPHLTVAQLCTKIFLYWNLEHAHHERQTPYSDAALQLNRLGPKKAAKLRRHVAKLYDRIFLGPLTLPGHCDCDEVSPHWRRGHFRMQSFGPQHAWRKVIFIAPTLVRADRLGESEQ